MTIGIEVESLRARSVPEGPRATPRAPQTNGGTATTERLTRGLGWFSVGLGLAEIAATRTVARLIGMNDRPAQRALLKAFGVRELASGLGILAAGQRSGWLWSRVAGDVMDLAFLAPALGRDNPRRQRTAAAAMAVAGVAALDLLASREMSRDETAGIAEDRKTRVREAISINRPPEVVYRFWRDFRNLARFMCYLESVEETGDGRSRWKAKGPAGTTVEWEAQTTADQPGALISWTSVEGGELDCTGSVRFTPGPGGKGTEVHVDIAYQPPLGKVGVTVAKLLGRDPASEIRADLRRLKQLIETGEIATGEGPSGRARPSLHGRSSGRTSS